MNRRNIILTLLLMTLVSFSSQGQNLLDLSDWTVGSGSITDFSKNGSTTENIREWGIGPQGERTVVWKSIPDGAGGPDGGWVSNSISIDHTKIYRYSLWIKKTNSNSGSSYFGCFSYPGPVLKLNGGENANPYFWYGDLPQLDKWYLLVGFIHGSGDTSSSSFGKMYDGATGMIVKNLTDYKFQTTATTAKHRAYLYYDTNITNSQYFYAPRMDEVNGNEPSITELLGIAPQNLSQLSVGTDNLPSGYTLSVGGEAIMEKVKVQLETAWPDYVFDKNYPLKSIEELKEFIAKKGHLPGLPSAAEVEESNQDLGLIQQKLLEKIEELTLYTIEQEKKLKGVAELKTENAELKSQYAILNTQFERLLKRIEKLEKKNK